MSRLTISALLLMGIGTMSPVACADDSNAEGYIAAIESDRQIDQRATSVADTLFHRTSCSAPAPRLFFGTEVAFLRPYLSAARSSAGGAGGKWVDPSHATGIRFNLGYENEDGLGIRTRYFALNHGAELASVFGGGSFGVDVESVDAEVTSRRRIGCWETMVSGGLRYGQLTYTGDGVITGPGRLSFEGIGPTMVLDARRRLKDSGLTIFGTLGASFLLGEIHNSGPTAGLAVGSVEDEILQVFSNQLGVSWLMAESDSLKMEVRAAWETQFWVNDTLADDFFGIGSNLALSGPAVQLEISY